MFYNSKTFYTFLPFLSSRRRREDFASYTILLDEARWRAGGLGWLLAGGMLTMTDATRKASNF